MKTLKFKIFPILFAVVLANTLIWSCSDDDDDPVTPESAGLTITAFTPTTARQLDTIAITGTGFNAINRTLNSVLFSSGGINTDGTPTPPSVPAIVVTATATQLEVIVPHQAHGDGPIKITVGEESVTSTQNFILNPASPNPILTSIEPVSGYVGAEITLTGDYFGEVIEDAQLYFNDVEAEIIFLNELGGGSIFDYQMKAIVPKSLEPGEAVIKVVREGYTSTNSLTFTVLETPSVAAIYWPLRYEIIKGELGESGSTTSTVYTNNDYISGLEVDAVNGMIYFFTGSEIKSVSTQGGTAATIFDGTADGLVVGAMTVDATSQKIYFDVYDFNNWAFEKIYRINADGTELTELYYFDWNVDPDAGLGGGLKVIDNNLYWTEMYKNRVVKALADGSSDLTNPDVIYDESDGITEPVSMAIDVANNKLYVFNNKYQNSGIVHGSLSGGTLTTLLTDSMDDPDADMYKASGQIRIDQEGYLYYINSAGGDYDHGVPTSIRRILIETGEVEELFAGDGVLGESLNSFDLEID